MPDRTTGKQAPHRLPIVVRMFAAFVAILGLVGLVWFGFAVLLPYLREQSVVQNIVTRNGRYATETFAQDWLLRLVGEDRTKSLKVFERVTAVKFSFAEVTDSDLAGLSKLTNLEELDLDDTGATDAGLASIAGLTNLTRLNLDGTAVTDAGLIHLRGLKNIKRLVLSGTAVTDAGLRQLSNLTTLRSLIVGRTAVTAEGIAELTKTLPTCKISRF